MQRKDHYCGIAIREWIFGDFLTTVRKGCDEIKIGFAIECNKGAGQSFEVKFLITIIQDEQETGYDRIGHVQLSFLGNEVSIDL